MAERYAEKMNHIEKSIKLVKSKLKCEVKHNICDETSFSYDFDQGIHIISTPTKSNTDEFWNLLFLHELIHALHKEILPIKFSENPTNVPIGTNREVANYFNTVKDWFVLGNLLEYCHEETKFYIEKEVEEFLRKVTINMDVKDRLIVGMLSAEAKLILDKNYFINNEQEVLSVRNELLKIDPKLPSVENLTTSVNGLFDIFGYFKLSISTKEQDDWEVNQINELPKKESNIKNLFKKFS
ncbi:MAG: hypothetical protein HOE90_24510 [Bacteriovoracaceae bacterium]|jgi:hypothetical protein|nr:hypothetical protein [Bacteriovoracaceae bacterium]